MAKGPEIPKTDSAEIESSFLTAGTQLISVKEKAMV